MTENKLLSLGVVHFIRSATSAVPVLGWREGVDEIDSKTRDQVVLIVQALDQIPVDWKSNTEDNVRATVREQMELLHPELSAEAIDALMWKFDYDWK